METSGHTEPSRILVVDDESYLRGMLKRILTKSGYTCLTAADGAEAWDVLQRNDCDLVVSDIEMPIMTGLELLGRVSEKMPRVAVIMLTGVADRATATSAVENGAYGYLIKPFDENELLINVTNALRRRDLEIMHDDYEGVLEEEMRRRTAEIRRREEEIVVRLIQAAEYRDEETGAHIRRLGWFAAEIARALGLSESEIADMRLAAPMHDIGKIGVPDTILLKPGKLTSEEFDIIKTHAEIGARILEGSDVPLIRMACDIAGCHHEKWDGSGYPRGLRGADIPEAARIVAMVDVFDALTSDRVYRRAYPVDEALAIMERDAGRHFDPAVFAHVAHLAALHRTDANNECH